VNSKEKNSLRLLSQLRPRIRPLCTVHTKKKNENRIKSEALDPLAAGLRVVDGVAG
jgi:hypothetical protein